MLSTLFVLTVVKAILPEHAGLFVKGLNLNSSYGHKHGTPSGFIASLRNNLKSPVLQPFWVVNIPYTVWI